jgi:membrane fusion protein (multidrug efflux system)
MADARNVVTTVSVIAAILAGGWAIYATKHADRPAAGPPMGMAPAGARPGSAGAPGAQGVPGAGPAAAGMGGGGRDAGPPVAVVTALVRSENVTRELKAIGTVRANESIEVTSKSSNIVTAVRFRDGQAVTRGQLLVELDSAQARADLAEANAALAESTSQFSRSRGLRETNVLSETQFEQLEATMKANQARVDAAEARVADTAIRAPFAGRVGLRRVSVGGLVNPGTVITTLDDTSVVKVDFGVPENLIGSLREGLTLTARSTAYADREFPGSVLSVDSRVDATTRSVTVRALVDNPGGLLKPGMFVNVLLAKDTREALVIPEQALVPEQSRQFVFVVVDGRVAKREVQIGRREPGTVEIVAGLEAGERIVTEGTQKVRDGAAVRELEPAAPASPAAPA